MLAKRLVGGVDPLESFFRLETLVLVVLKPIGMPELGRSPIRLVNRRLRVRRVPRFRGSWNAEGKLCRRTPFATSLTRRQRIEIPAQFVQQLLSFVPLLLQALNNVHRSLGRKAGIVQLTVRSWR